MSNWFCFWFSFRLHYVLWFILKENKLSQVVRGIDVFPGWTQLQLCRTALAKSGWAVWFRVQRALRAVITEATSIHPPVLPMLVRGLSLRKGEKRKCVSCRLKQTDKKLWKQMGLFWVKSCKGEWKALGADMQRGWLSAVVIQVSSCRISDHCLRTEFIRTQTGDRSL